MNVSGVMNSSVSQILGRISWTSIAENDAVEIIRCSIAGASEASVRSSCVMNGLNVGDEIDRLRDRLTRFEIRARFGDDRAMWDPSRDWASQGPPEVIINKNQAAVDATPLASSPNKLGNNFRQWRNMHNISDSSSLMNTVIDGNNGQGRHRDEESAESVAQSEDELRDREMNQVHTEQQRPRESLNGGRPLSMDREEIANVEERVEQVAARDFEQGHVTGATSTVRRVAFVNESSAANRNDANRATLGEFGGATPAAFVTAQSQLYQSEILGAGRNDIRRGSGVYEAGDATGGHDEMREGHGLGTGMATGVRGRPNSRESQGVTYGRGGLRERGGSLTRYENSRYGPHVDGWSSMPNSMGGERRNTLSNSAWNGSVGFNSTLAREKNTCELYRQWGLIFRDSGKNNPELFISRLMTCAGRYQLSLDDICRTLPAVLDMEACAWLEREEKEWKTLKDMAEAFRLQYCDEGTQQCLRQEIEARTQGPKEEISVFLLKIRLLLDQLKPPLCMREQIDRAYMNLHPSYRRAFSREQCVTFREFQKLGKLEELKRRQELAYREPPKSENVMFRNAAYVEPEESRSVAAVVIASVEEREKERDNKSDSKQRDKNIKCYRCQKKGHIAARCRTKLKCEKCGVEVTKFRLCNNCWRNRKSDKKDQAEKPEAPAVAVISDRGVSVNEAEMAPEVNGRMIEMNVANPTALLGIIEPCDENIVYEHFSDVLVMGGDVENRHFIDIKIDGVLLHAMLDSGAVRSYLGGRAEKLFAGKFVSCKNLVRVANGEAMRMTGIVKARISIDQVSEVTLFGIVRGLEFEALLGRDFMKKMDLTVYHKNDEWKCGNGPIRKFAQADTIMAVSSTQAEGKGLEIVTEQQRQRVTCLLDELIPKTPLSLGICNLATHRIDVQDHAPIRQKVRKYSPPLLRAAQAEVDRMLREEIIEKSESPWHSCPVIVPKPNGKYRFCLDYRQVNAVTKKNAYPMRHMDDILDKLREAKFISKLDLSQAYHQILLEEKSKEITAFSVQGRGHFQFRRMPYGLTNAPGTFQALMDRLIGPEWEPHVFSYLDDIIIVTNDFEEHLIWLKRVLSALKEANLQINREKSEFLCSEVKYLGYVVDGGGLRVDNDKVKPIVDYPAPVNTKQLKRFLGMIAWYGRFIKDAAELKAPLTELLRKDVAWNWTEKHQKAFEELKAALTEAPVLIRPNFEKPFSVQTDASDFAVAGVLSQEIDGEEHPIYFVSRTLNKAERNYTVTEKECLAVLFTVEKLQGYLRGERFKVITDHHSLLWLNNLKDPAGRLARWHTRLQAFDIEFVHRKGSAHQLADSLSRACEGQIELAVMTTGEDTWYERHLKEVAESPSKFEDLKVQDGKLYALRKKEADELLGDHSDDWKLALPNNERERAIYEAHDVAQAGHLGIDKTYTRVATYYYWPGIYADVVDYVKSCHVCQEQKSSNQARSGLMGQRHLEGPWSVVAADIIGPKPASKGGVRYVLVFVDLFTKYVELIGLKKANGKTVVKAMDELIINRWGCPRYLLTDNGTEFVNKDVGRYLASLGVEQTTIPPYIARCNPTERVNRNLRSMIASYIEEDQTDWDLHLQELKFALNTAHHDSIGTTPSFLNFGRHPLPALQLRKEAETPIELLPNDPERWLVRAKRLPYLYDLVKKYLNRANEEQRKYFNKGRREINFNLGDLVMRKNHILSNKSKNFHGDCEIRPKIIILEIFPKQLNMWPGRGKRPREDLTERARTRSVTFRYARRPGMDQNGEFPDGSEDSRPFRLFCRSSTRACYRGGRHICLTVRTRSPVEEVQARGREEPGAVLPGVAAIEPAVEHLAAPDVIDAEEVAGGLAEGGPSTERLARSESSVAMEIEPPAAAEAELAGPGEVEAQDFAWPEIRVRWDEPEPRVDLGALGPIRPGCWNCGAINSGHSHVNCPDPIRRRYCFWCGEPGYSKSTCPRCSPLWQRYLASGKTRSSRPGYYKR
uniref:RNA-directed DNA polymerase n=1 Tax=Trichogramma kaykai TaxID=54128 RepID=A0ABD2WNZ3_9HYME